MNDLTKLFSIRHIEKEIRILERREWELRQDVLPSGIRYDKDRVQATASNAMERYGWDLLELEQAVTTFKCQLRDTVREVMHVVMSMENSEHRVLLQLRYIDGKSWKDVSEEMGYSESHIKGYMKEKAIDEYKQTEVNTL